MATTTRTQDIYTLVRPTWLDAAGMGKGIDHDRQHLGFILGTDETIRVRQINPDFTTELVLRLLNNDNKTETSLKVGSDWVALIALAPSVPFIDTPYIDGSPRVEFEYPDSSKVLPVYKKGDDEASFISEWENKSAEYSLIESTFTRILVPAGDIKNVKALEVQGGIDGLIDFYESLFTSFNATAGLSFEPEQPTDLNIPNRYFMKLDNDGAGGAYYGTYWTAQSEHGSIKKFWLSPDISNWGCGHEIGHGYQGMFGSDKTFYTGEIWNNIYVVYWQDAMDPQARYNVNGLYNGKQDFFEWAITDHLQKRIPVATWGLGQRNYFFILMIDAAGVSSFTHFNQLYRKNMNSADYVPENHPILDLLADSLATSGNRIDVVPFMQLWGAPISVIQRDRNLYNGANAAYSLNQLFANDTLAEQKLALNLDTDFDLVTVEQINNKTASGTFTLTLNIDDFSQIEGASLIVMDGTRKVHEQIITDPTFLMPALPIGPYSLRLPYGRNKKYQSKSDYLLVKDGVSDYEIKFISRSTSVLVSQQVWFIGLGTSPFGSLLTDPAKKTIKIAITRDTPHSYIHETYISISIKDLHGVETFALDVPGVGATVDAFELHFEEGYQVEVMHYEFRGFTTTVPGLIDTSTKSQSWIMTSFGLKNVALDTYIEGHFLFLVENMVKELRSDPAIHKVDGLTKVEIYLALQAFDSPEREQLMQLYSDCIPADNGESPLYPGTSFDFIFSDPTQAIMVLQMDLTNRKVIFDTFAVNIDDGDSPSPYASITLTRPNGDPAAKIELLSHCEYPARHFTLLLTGLGGEILTLFHKDAAQYLSIRNTSEQLDIPSSAPLQRFLITTSGLKLIPAD